MQVSTITSPLFNEGRIESSSTWNKRNLAKWTAISVLFAGTCYAIYHISNQSKALYEAINACQKTYDDKVKQCEARLHWCGSSSMEGINNFRYPSLPNRSPGETLDHRYLRSLDLTNEMFRKYVNKPIHSYDACLDYNAFLNKTNMGFDIPDYLKPESKPLYTSHDVLDFCRDTTENYCPSLV